MQTDEAKLPKILVVDDSRTNLVVFSASLTQAGYQVVEASCGEEALDKVFAEMPDLVLLDIVLPDINGLDICRILKHDKRSRFIPIILITAFQEVSDKVKGLEVGADDFIAKSFDQAELLARVKSLLRIKQQQDALLDKQNELDKKNFQLQSLVNELKAANTILNEELIMARKVQENILPRQFPAEESLHFSAKYIPTMAIGGDFYFFTKIKPGVIGVIVSDVAGHGLSAALVTMAVKTILGTYEHLEEDENLLKIKPPNELLSYLNEQLIDILDSDIFVTASYIIIDLENKKIIASNAGHPYPALLRPRTGEAFKLSKTGFCLSMFGGAEFPVEELDVQSGDLLLMYTDGLFEIRDKDNKQLGLNRMIEFALKNSQDGPDNLVERLTYMVQDYAGEVAKDDDLTIVAIGFD